MIAHVNPSQKKGPSKNPLEYVAQGLQMANSVANIGEKVSDMKAPTDVEKQFAKYRLK